MGWGGTKGYYKTFAIDKMKGRLLFMALLIGVYTLGAINAVFGNTYLLYVSVFIFMVIGFFSDKLIKLFSNGSNK